jgi:hypothetical protein
MTADSLRLANPTTHFPSASLAPSAEKTLFARFGSLFTRAALGGAQETSDEGVWRGVGPRSLMR